MLKNTTISHSKNKKSKVQPTQFHSDFVPFHPNSPTRQTITLMNKSWVCLNSAEALWGCFFLFFFPKRLWPTWLQPKRISFAQIEWKDWHVHPWCGLNAATGIKGSAVTTMSRVMSYYVHQGGSALSPVSLSLPSSSNLLKRCSLGQGRSH